MQKLFSPEALRAAADFVVVLDRHRFGACVFLGVILAALLFAWS